MRDFINHLKKYILRGLLAIIPLVLSIFVINLVYVSIDDQALRWFERMFGFRFPGLGIVLVLLVLYLIGHIASRVAGGYIFGIIEKATGRIPLINMIYQIGKQVAHSFSLPDRQVFKRVVLVDYLMPGIWTIGFVTGKVVNLDEPDEPLLKVFIPTPPNPTSGTMVLVKECQTLDPGWTIEEALNAVISGGIIGPELIRPTRIAPVKTGDQSPETERAAG